MSNPLISLNEYLLKKKPFLIPNYQRGYVWGKSRGTEKDSVQFLIESIRNCFSNNADLFLQGVTVSENDQEIELIDGQQRTTALYLLLHYLGYKGDFSIKYPIRTESQDFIDSIKNLSKTELTSLCCEYEFEEFQDIFFFKKTIRVFDNELKEIDNEALLKFLLEDNRLRFLYIDIPKDKATTVFTMMNGNKAVMLYEEVIKAEMLRLVSHHGQINPEMDAFEIEAFKWDQNLLRSKYAREWDKWLNWWNRDEVRAYFYTSNVMGLLIETYFYSKCPKLKFNFENFRDKLLRGGNNTSVAKIAFYELRQLQKRFEDVYNSFNEIEKSKRNHNKIGAILALLDSNNRKQFIRTYFNSEKKINLDEFLKLAYLRLTYSQIEQIMEGKDDELFKTKKEELLYAIKHNYVYPGFNDAAFTQLLRRNVEEDTKLGRKFDFSIWKERSLEHIYPKSKVFHFEDGSYKNGSNEIIKDPTGDLSFMNREDFKGNGSEHCIGNLVLLYNNENSGFGAKEFDEKKRVYFDLIRDNTFRSRHLIHSISVFACSKWDALAIQENQELVVNEIIKYHGL